MNQVTGFIFIEADGDETGRFLTLCRDQGIDLKHFQKKGGKCYGFLPPKQYKQASGIGKTCGVRLSVQEKTGLPFLLHRYRKRIGFFAGAAFCIGTLLFLQCFLWAIDVNGCKELTPRHVLSVLEECGLKKGLFLPGANLEKIEMTALTELPTLSFLSLNRIGSRVEVELTEETPKPRIASTTPCNLVAAKTGQIVSMEVYRGQPAIQAKQVVYEGELLVSGITETPDGKISYQHARGKVLAETLFEKEFSLDLEQTEKVYTGEKKVRRRMDLLGVKLPLFLAIPIEEDYDLKKELKPLNIWGVEFPIGIETETYEFFTPTPRTFTEEEALAVLKENMALYEEEELSGGEILSREMSAQKEGDRLILTVTYSCLENIAVPRLIELKPQ